MSRLNLPVHVFHDRRVMFDVGYVILYDDPRMGPIRFHHCDDNVCKGVRKYRLLRSCCTN